jgi:hypothetical protein
MNISGFALTAVMSFEGSLSADEKMMITGIAALVVLIALLLLSTLTGQNTMRLPKAPFLAAEGKRPRLDHSVLTRALPLRMRFQLIRHPHQVGDRGGIHFAHDLTAVHLGGHFTDS